MRKKATQASIKEHWLVSMWRPAMAWLYIVVCAFDFLVAPIMWSVLQAISHGQVTSQWSPLTLQAGGLFHVAMCTVLGITSYGRTREKMLGASPILVPTTTTAQHQAMGPMNGPGPGQ